MLAGYRQARQDREGGFSLIELLVVVIIIGVLAGIAIPVFLQERLKANDAAAKSDLRNAATTEEAYLTDNHAYESTTNAATDTNLTRLGFRGTTGVQVAVTADSSSGYCAVGKSASGNYFVYDSTGGGLKSSAATSFTTIGWPSGTCATSTNRPASF